MPNAFFSSVFNSLVPDAQSSELEDRDRKQNSLHKTRENNQQPATALGNPQDYGVGCDLLKDIQRAGKNAHQANLHHVPAVLANQVGPS